jgi:hypothetical protein
MPKLSPKPGTIGLPADVKETGRRVDFRTDEYILAIETKGYRVAWSRASYCPCKPINDQTDQADPNCSICEGSGWIRFRPSGAITNEDITGELDDIQQAIVDDEAAVIRALMSGITNERKPYDEVLPRLEGMMNATVRTENKLGYHDRLVNLDSTIVYSQVHDYTGGTTMKLRYPVRAINLMRSESQTFVEDTDFKLVTGNVEWLSGQEPPEDERLAIHYLTHPTWRVVQHPHAVRLTPVKSKTKSKVGDPVAMAVQAVCQLEFML